MARLFPLRQATQTYAGYLGGVKLLRKGRAMVTLADVARLAGVSLATASRVFGRPDKVGLATASSVIAAAEELGYVANSTARALATGTTGLLGLIVPDLSSSYFAPIIAAVQTEAERSGFELVIADSRGAVETEGVILKRLQGRVDGVIMASPRGEDAVIAKLAQQHPLVVTNRVIAGVDSVSIDVSDGLEQLCKTILSRGHKRVAYLGGPAGSLTDDARFHAIEEILRNAQGEAVRLGPVEPNTKAGADSFNSVCDTGVSAVIAYNSVVAYGLLLAAGEANYSVPLDLAIAAADDVVEVGLGLITITALRQPLYEVGISAGRALVERATAAVKSHTRSAQEASLKTDYRLRLTLPTTLALGDTC